MEEQRADFIDTAAKRYAGIVASGKTIPWNEMRRCLKHHLARKKAARPVARKLAR